ncbi:pyridoxamine 5'-phosphate oxidase family protein [Ilumatobacter nonamiensis]|uniref:pyridoxamine 5'-phosphate oxidase family protein n=1 Tax=Ilumatobacter nonamiensis TaxID=467093 RepID=UPI00034BAA75|nr:pyridoxamine 5'-phosphate oxidase family protein [Ilumatobacter nonamiensis]
MTRPAAPATDGPASARTTLRRGANRAQYADERIRAILSAGVIAHVGVTTDDGPIVLPMAYGVRPSSRGGHEVLIHGALANAMLRAGRSVDVCLTVTIVDGLVVARTPFHNSMNYRSVVVRGTATAIDEPEQKLAALRTINDHITPIWGTARPPSAADLKKTLVLAVPLDEASAKVRSGDPVDEAEDLDGPHWAGVVPLSSRWGAPLPAADLRSRAPIPSAVAQLDGQDAHAEA